MLYNWIQIPLDTCCSYSYTSFIIINSGYENCFFMLFASAISILTCPNNAVSEHRLTVVQSNTTHNFIIQCDSFGTRPKKMRISQRLFIRFWTCIYDYISCFMRSMSILVCRSLISWRNRDNDWRLASRRAQPCHCVVR